MSACQQHRDVRSRGVLVADLKTVPHMRQTDLAALSARRNASFD
jgi:hypothetical protein